MKCREVLTALTLAADNLAGIFRPLDYAGLLEYI